MNHSGSGAGFREGMAWTMGVAISVAYPCVMGAVLLDPASVVRTAWLYGGFVVFLIVVPIIASIVLSGATEDEPDDERDKAIERRSARYSHIVMNVGVVLAAFLCLGQSLALDLGGAIEEFLFDPVFPAHLLIFFLTASEAVRLFTTAIDYRTGR